MSDEEGQTRARTDGVSRFTLIEWLVASAIILILVNAAMPNFGKLRDKAKEAEVKQALHSIQDAIEKYATDRITDGLSMMAYPPYLYGGDAYFNFGTATMLGRKRPFPFGWQVLSPFDKFYPSEYAKHGAIGSETAKFGDPLIQEGYLTSYPKNPFVGRNFRKWFGSEGVLLNDPSLQGFIGCGGAGGDAMFNVGWLGELPAVNIYKKPGDPNDLFLDFPGQFYYHPWYADGGTVTEHIIAKAMSRRIPYATPPGAKAESGYRLLSDRVESYNLVAFGSPRNEGMDLDWSVPWKGVSGGENHAFREGYIAIDMRNPFNSAGGFRPRQKFDPMHRGDGYGDFYLVVTGPFDRVWR